jgi:hypothetical protein
VSNYPDGVTDAHPYFNPQEGSVHVVCGNDEAKVVPVHALSAALEELRVLAGGDYKADSALNRPANHGTIIMRIEALREQVAAWEQDADYECPFEGVMDVAISEEAEWTCPLCGATRVSDTLPEERDPDEGWDSRHDD